LNPGELKKRNTVQCADCCLIDDTELDQKAFIRQLRKEGWKLVKGMGWLCPICAQTKDCN
jgi:hypothetical protein